MMIYCHLVNHKCIVYDDIYTIWDILSMKTPKDWETQAKTLLKVELTKRNITYAQLCGLLADVGVFDSEPNIRNKISRGKFTAVFLLQCLEAIAVEEIRVSSFH